ncbi:hypothetical protein HYQ46_010606 [Verticillium longisporum]|nr:hypothetical protein HYQ46_010606 [Verticillium longisporum]
MYVDKPLEKRFSEPLLLNSGSPELVAAFSSGTTASEGLSARGSGAACCTSTGFCSTWSRTTSDMTLL